MGHVLAARYRQTGPPDEVVASEKVEMPPPGPGEVCVSMICAPINPADLNMLEGVYGEARPLPDTPGNEGCGRIAAVGPGVDGSWLGRLVLVDSLAWRQQGNWPLNSLVPVPDGLEARHACVLRVNPPTAWLLLHAFALLRPGDWVVQNAATSAVGRAVIELAKAEGWKTMNIVRRPEAAEELLGLGADAVAVDGDDLVSRTGPLTGGTRPLLGLNAVGGAPATRLAGLLDDGGTLVTFGAMSKQALKIPNGFLIFRDLVFRGFWLSRWLRKADDAERDRVYGEVFRLAAAGAFAPNIAAEFPLDRVKEAVALAASGSASGKVLLQLGA